MAAGSTFQSELQQLRYDIKSFIETRYEMLRAELTAGLSHVRSAAVLLAAAALFAATGLILLGFCVSFAIALAFGAFHNQVGLLWGFLCTGGGSLMLAGIIGVAGRSKLNPEKLVPKHTLRVLKRDGESFRKAGDPYGDESGIRRSA
jgi:Putative Actinobacterial Holin-X, holin superfamily III